MKSLEIIYRLDEISGAAEKFLKHMKGKKIFTFSGELGAGKTTFISALCRILGVEEIVSSPTFSIIRQYSSNKSGTIYHIDLYRIKDEEEAINSGVEDCLTSGDICMVEWPENAAGIFSANAVHTDISVVDKETRKLLIHLPE